MWRRLILKAGLIVLVCAVASASVSAQDATATTAAYSPAALDQLLKPIALYPDPLLAQVLTAATLPSQIVLADRYASQGGDPAQVAQQPWDPSVQALVHYPTVLTWLDDNLAWTTAVGEAFLNQQQDVMDSVQRLRAQAQAAGNLPSTPQENVVADGGDVEIEPADPNVIYVPTYPWDTIYDDPGIYCAFGAGFPIGVWLGYDWDWHNHHIIAWGAGFPRPRDWWQRPPGGRIAPRGAPMWHPAPRLAAGISRGADRGFGADAFRPARVPATPAPSVGLAARPGLAPRQGLPPVISRPPISPRENPPAEVSRPALESRAPVEARPAPEMRAPSGVSAFGGPESAPEAHASSVRGSESRGAISGGSSGGGRRR
jgi:hypothetical protein